MPTNCFIFLWHFIKKQYIGFILVLCCALVWAVNEVFFPYLLKTFINTIANLHGHQNEVITKLKLPFILLFSVWSLMEFCMRLQGLMLIKLFPKFRAQIRHEVMNYTLEHSYEYFANHFSGSIAKKINELPNSAQTMVEIIFFYFSPVLVAFIIGNLMMWQVNPWFAFILSMWCAFHMSMSYFFLRKGTKLHAKHAEAVSTLSGKIVDTITNIITIRSFSNKKFELNYLKKFQQDEVNKAHKAMWNMQKMYFLQGMSGLLLIFSIVTLLVYSWVRSWINIGDFTLISMLAFQLLGMIWVTSFQLSLFIREHGTIQEALSLVSVPHDIKDSLDAIKLKVQQGKINFINVNFRYREKQVIFSDLNVCIPGGQRLGLVGFSGAGKSTFINLILRYYELNRGKIEIDGQDITKLTQDSLRDAIAVIPQEASLFHRTIMENIQYGKLDAAKEEIFQAAKLAHCDEFISHLADGYNSLVGEKGIKLSGGQRQRIAIARAFLKNAPILILDEATSSLDSVTERLIQHSLINLMKNRTTIVIAHRLSTLAQLDRILVFDKGRIIEDGTQQELIAKNGHFARLWNMQVNGFLLEEEK